MVDTLDLTALKNLKDIIGGNANDLQELVDDFVSELPRQLRQMHDQSGRGDLKGLRITAHGCKSNARDLGALNLSQLCTQLEVASVAKDTTNVPALLEQISIAVEAALTNYESLDVSDV